VEVQRQTCVAGLHVDRVQVGAEHHMARDSVYMCVFLEKFSFFWVVLGFELRAACLLATCSIT
jgi:hypothetical protein